MPEIIVIIVAFFALFGLPLISGLFARRQGRRFWFWFLIGCILPVISVFILAMLPDLSEDHPGTVRRRGRVDLKLLFILFKKL